MSEDDFSYPPREEIRAALVEVSDFSSTEVEELSWDELYEAYGRIVRYEESDVEEDYR